MGLSKDNLTLNAGIDRSHIGHIERGEVDLTFENLYKLAA
ncbi:helix-turn-helix domain-containing protein [Marinobacterium zhoushanense]|nr:helix-turn-helix transcriptional regulator [Marinobacterium zhoushanense]